MESFNAYYKLFAKCNQHSHKSARTTLNNELYRYENDRMFDEEYEKMKSKLAELELIIYKEERKFDNSKTYGKNLKLKRQPTDTRYRESYMQLRAFWKAEAAILEIFHDDPSIKRFITGACQSREFVFDEIFKRTLAEVISFKMSLLKQSESEALTDNMAMMDILEETFHFCLSAKGTRYENDIGKDCPIFSPFAQ